MTNFMNQSVAALAAVIIAFASINAVVTVPPVESVALIAPVLA